MEGHQKAATFDNKLGRSAYFCYDEREKWDNKYKNTNNKWCTLSHNHSTFNKYVIAKGDSAVSDHYWRQEDIQCLTWLTNSPGLAATLPNSTLIQADQQGTLPIPKTLLASANSVVALPSLKSLPLISLEQLCDNDYRVLLDKKEALCHQRDKHRFKGGGNRTNGLWEMKNTILWCLQ